MKWFSNVPLSNDPVILIDQCIEYINKSGDRPEKWATVNLIFDEMRRVDLPKDILKKLICLNFKKINYWLAIHGSDDAISIFLDRDSLDQSLISNLLYNPNLTLNHLDKFDRLIDDSPKGEQNRKILNRRYEQGT